MNHSQPLTLLGGLTAQQFLSEYWQKKPLLIRNAIPNFETPVSPDELAGMALEPDANVRLVQEKHPERDWHVTYAPLEEDIFSTLPESHWTFLVTDCEKHWPELRELVEPFRFIPDWRIDDLMISYAAPQGGIGPHIDEYDVFLLQLHGQRRWQIHEHLTTDEVCIEDIELKILQTFEPDQDWVMNPGDLLYLPPRIAHYGVGVGGDCMTASIGFRAPDQEKLLQGFMDECEDRGHFQRYGDPDLKPQTHPGEIRQEALDELWALLQSAMQMEPQERNEWLGRFLTDVPTQPETEVDETESFDDFLLRWSNGEWLERSGFSRIAYTESGDSLVLFANGESWTLPANTLEDIQSLCGGEPINQQTLQNAEPLLPILYELYCNEVLDWSQ